MYLFVYVCPSVYACLCLCLFIRRCLSVCPVCLSVCLSILYACLPARLSVCLVGMSVCATLFFLYVSSWICQLICLYNYLSVYLGACHSASSVFLYFRLCLSVSLSVCQSWWLRYIGQAHQMLQGPVQKTNQISPRVELQLDDSSPTIEHCCVNFQFPSDY